MMVLFIVISLISKEELTYSFNISDSDELCSVTYNVFSISEIDTINLTDQLYGRYKKIVHKLLFPR